jgi:hypothetical protein
MTTRAIACAFCKHFEPNIRDRSVCTAFPNGIPNEINYGYIHHVDPWSGDNGIRFEPLPGFEYMSKHFESMDQRLIEPSNPRRRPYSRQIPWARPKR